jgi:hypothetical protein
LIRLWHYLLSFKFTRPKAQAAGPCADDWRPYRP